MPYIDMDKIRDVSSIISGISIKPMDLYDTKFYPAPTESTDRILTYFLAMVSIDHRLSRPDRQYKAVIDGEELSGADLLYRLGMKMFVANPDFFTPQNLSRISVEDVRSWLSVGEVSPPDPEVRSMLLKDLGKKILTFFEGSTLRLIEVSKGYLRRKDGNGFLDLLKVFKAYSDPVEKKSMLLVKFLSYRGILDVVDKENIRVAVDNHLTRIAIRLGIITLEKFLEEKILCEIPVGYSDDVVIRYTVREAYQYLSTYANVNPFILDDFLWDFGRRICLRNTPRCVICRFRYVCKAYEVGAYPNEHLYYDTWYY